MMTDKRLIDANALAERINECWFLTRHQQVISTSAKLAAADAMCKLLAEVAKQPTVDAEHVVHGRWQRLVVDRRHQIEADECSVCGLKYGGLGIESFRYCPGCGAKMDL